MQKIKVSLRKKKISKDRVSLYLDFYPAKINQKTGIATRREFLKKYLYNKPKNDPEKHHNKETARIAEHIKQVRQNEFDKPEIYTAFEKEQLKKKELEERSFIEYFQELADKRKGNTYGNWISAVLI